jgi:acyl carrier protein
MLRAGAAQLSLEEFWVTVCEAMRLEPMAVERDTTVRDDLEFDSLDMAELVVLMDDLDCEVPDGLIPSLETVGDFYDHYRTRTTGRTRSQ